MNTIHKNTRTLPHQRKEMIRLYLEEQMKAAEIAEKFSISERRFYVYLRRHRQGDQELKNKSSLPYAKLIPKLKNIFQKRIRQTSKLIPKRYEKKHPGEMVHFDTKRLPFVRGHKKKEYLFVAIDDFSRELWAGIKPNKNQGSAKDFLQSSINYFEYRIERAYSDNGKEYKGRAEHEFVKLCTENDIKRRYTKKARPQTNGKAERVIRTLMEMWHKKSNFNTPNERQRSLQEFVKWYNEKKPHASLEGRTPKDILNNYFYNLSLNNV